MRRLAAIFAILLVLLQPHGVGAPRGLIGIFGDTGDPTAIPPSPADPASPPTPPLAALTLSGIFGGLPSLARLDPRKLITLLATGDVIPARSVNYIMSDRGDFTYPFRRTYRYTRAADITLINLEAPLIDGCGLTNDGMTFCGDPQVTAGLRLAGVDVANLPNNHIGNYGLDAIHETERHLADAGIQWDGFGHNVYKTIKGVSFAFLGFNAVGEQVDLVEMRREVRHARTKADVVVVSYHWGKEYSDVPLTSPGVADQDPRMLAHATVDAGADLVIGNHPHWVQGVELYRGKYIAYAHGNFVFDQMFSMRTRHGVIGTYTFYGARLVAVRYRAVQIENWSQPHFLPAAEEAPILADMDAASRLIASGYKDEGCPRSCDF